MSSRYQEEGLRVALEMELRGMSLYTRAQECTEDPEMITLLVALAKDEKQHHATFWGMLDALGGKRVSREENALIAAKAADVFLPGGLMQVAMEGALASPLSMLECAMRAEQDSIAFYGRLRELLLVEDHAAVDEIIREEEGHLRALSIKKEQIEGEKKA